MKKKKVKTRAFEIPNIFYINVETGQRRGFYTEEEANYFIDHVEEPRIWDCELREEYEKRYLEAFEKQQKENELTEEDKEIFKFISYGNSKISIEKYLNKNLDDSYKRLLANKLIVQESYEDFKVTDSGKITLAWREEDE